jgi:hypothetical protein
MARIVIELPDQLKDFGVALQNAAERIVHLAANGSSGKSMDYARIEREVGDLAAAVERAGHQGLLAGLDLNAERLSSAARCILASAVARARTTRWPVR